MKLLIHFHLFIVALLLFTQRESHARLEYAARHHVNRCTACHASPVGGGPRNLNGKYYGARGFPALNPSWTTDFVAVDFRSLFYHSESVTSTRNGLGVMAANVSANVPLAKENENVTRLVWTHNLGGFPGGAGGPREGYVRHSRGDEAQVQWWPNQFLFGRFHAPFGVVTDEHRTYTRMVTHTTWNQFEMGAMISGDPSYDWHYDLALVNGEQTGGASLTNGQALVWGSIANIRYSPARIPLLIGLSGKFHRRLDNEKNPYAFSTYAVYSINRKWRGSVIVEFVTSQHTNSRINNFVSDNNFFTSLADARAQGWLFNVNWDLTDFLTLVYKFDRMILNHTYPADAYDRHGAGMSWRFSSYGLLMLRYEKALAGHPLEEEGEQIGAQDATWAVLRISF